MNSYTHFTNFCGLLQLYVRDWILRRTFLRTLVLRDRRSHPFNRVHTGVFPSVHILVVVFVLADCQIRAYEYMAVLLLHRYVSGSLGHVNMYIALRLDVDGQKARNFIAFCAGPEGWVAKESVMQLYWYFFFFVIDWEAVRNCRGRIEWMSNPGDNYDDPLSR